MTIEFWNAFFQWGSVGLVALAFVFVAGALWTSNELHDRQSARLLQLETEYAKAQRSLKDQQGATVATGRPSVESPELSARTLDASARASFLDSLKRVQPEGPLEIRFVSASSPEPGAFARALANVIEEAGWPLTDADTAALPAFGTPPVGLLVWIPEKGDAPPRAVRLHEALNRAGLEAKIERVATVEEGRVALMVGLRP